MKCALKILKEDYWNSKAATCNEDHLCRVTMHTGANDRWKWCREGRHPKDAAVRIGWSSLSTMKGALIKFVCSSCGLRNKYLPSRCQILWWAVPGRKRFKYSKCQISFFNHWHGLDEDVGHHRIPPCPSEILMLPSRAQQFVIPIIEEKPMCIGQWD